MTPHLVPFLAESLRIEGITRPPLLPEIEATQKFLDLPRLTVDDVSVLVKVYQPDAVLRDEKGLNLRVGHYVAPPGGAQVPRRLASILGAVNGSTFTTYEAQVSFAKLRPFTAGNGPSGRAVWAWQRIRSNPNGLEHGFLRPWYEESLEAQR